MLGEYWITNDGRLLDAGKADGPNHEKWVFLELKQQFLKSLVDSRFSDLAEHLRELDDPTSLRCAINDFSDMISRGGRDARITEQECNHFSRTLRRAIGWSEDKYDTFLDNNDAELRDYANRVWGWIRTTDNYLQFWRLTRPQLRRACDGIDKLPGPLPRKLIIAERYSNVMFYDVPYVALQLCNVAKLRPYRAGVSAIPHTAPQA